MEHLRRNAIETDPLWLATADELSSELIARAAPILFEIAESPKAQEAAYRLRHDVVVELGWSEPADHQVGMETDEYDDRAHQLVAWDGDVIAGTVRLIIPKPGLLLPVEEAFGLNVEPRGRVVGAGRLIVARPYRDGRHLVLGGLAAKTWLHMRELGFHWVAGTATADMLGLFGHLGFEVEVLGDPQTYWGDLRYPIRMGAADPRAWRSHQNEDGRG